MRASCLRELPSMQDNTLRHYRRFQRSNVGAQTLCDGVACVNEVWHEVEALGIRGSESENAWHSPHHLDAPFHVVPVICDVYCALNSRLLI